jgi:pimeloyl-ACP methyl ester carboxylesterase
MRHPSCCYTRLVHKHYRPRHDQLPIFGDAVAGIDHTALRHHLSLDHIIDSRDTARRFTKLVPHATVTVVPDAGHALTDDREAIHRFLAEGLDR